MVLQNEMLLLTTAVKKCNQVLLCVVRQRTRCIAAWMRFPRAETLQKNLGLNSWERGRRRAHSVLTGAACPKSPTADTGTSLGKWLVEQFPQVKPSYPGVMREELEPRKHGGPYFISRRTDVAQRAPHPGSAARDELCFLTAQLRQRGTNKHKTRLGRRWRDRSDFCIICALEKTQPLKMLYVPLTLRWAGPARVLRTPCVRVPNLGSFCPTAMNHWTEPSRGVWSIFLTRRH